MARLSLLTTQAGCSCPRGRKFYALLAAASSSSQRREGRRSLRQSEWRQHSTVVAQAACRACSWRGMALDLFGGGARECMGAWCRWWC